YPFQGGKAGDYRVVAEVEVRGSFEFDPSRVQLVFKLDGQEKIKVEHVWLNQKTFRYEVAGSCEPGQDHRFDLELTPLPPAKEENFKGKKGTTNLQQISVKLHGPLDRKDWPYVEGYERIFFRGDPPAGDAAGRKCAREVLQLFVRKG